METICFSSWDGRRIDNRKGKKAPAGGRLRGVPAGVNGSPYRALMGWNGLVVADASADVPSLAWGYLRAARALSCGECSVCMIGIDRLLDIFGSWAVGAGKREDLAEIEGIVRNVSSSAKCNYGGSSLRVLGDAIKAYRGDFLAVIAGGRKLEELALSTGVDAPCVHRCPARLDIPAYIGAISNGRFGESLAIVRERCVLPGVIGRACPAPCEEGCVRKEIDAPLEIRLLKRAAADWELRGVPTALYGLPLQQRPEKVAVIGAGPGGLAAASQLRRMGYGVSVFEAQPYAGGMAKTGIPDYRLPKEVLSHEIELVWRLGVDIRTSAAAEGLSIEALRREGYRAVFIAVGAQSGTRMGCEGEDAGYGGYLDGVEFLRGISEGRKAPPGKKVVIVGGGNVAIDCARTCKRLGFKEVEILYRRTRAEMPAHEGEIKAAEEEGVAIVYLAAPKALIAKGGRLSALECIRMKLGAPDGSGRRRPVPLKGSGFRVACDAVIAATGQKPELGFLKGIATTGWGTIKADPATFATSVPGVFAGGDCVSGPATLIEALNAGNEAARAIDAYLNAGTFKPLERYEGIDPGAKRDQIYVARRAAGEAPELAPAQRAAGFAEVEEGLTAAAAVEEAKRCLRCYRLMVWE